VSEEVFSLVGLKKKKKKVFSQVLAKRKVFSQKEKAKKKKNERATRDCRQ
jgi:hypothetical protein